MKLCYKSCFGFSKAYLSMHSPAQAGPDQTCTSGQAHAYISGPMVGPGQAQACRKQNFGRGLVYSDLLGLGLGSYLFMRPDGQIEPGSGLSFQGRTFLGPDRILATYPI